jgi:uncharacterized membrane protein YcfT
MSEVETAPPAAFSARPDGAAMRRASNATPRARRLDLDRAKGIAILLVVLGHIVATAPPVGAEWWDTLRYAIYRFHMPFFLYLSGYVAWITGAAATPTQAWPRLAAKRAERLLLPFLLFGLVILLGKLGAQQFVHVDNRPDGLLGGLRDLLVTTGRSPALSVWYLLVLFLCSLAAPPLLRGLGTTGLVLAALALQLVELPAIAYLDRFARYLLYFALGCWVAAREERLMPIFDHWQPLAWAVFAATLAAALAGWIDEWWSLVVCGAACIPALHGAMRVAPVARWSWPLVIGGFSMVIYLFNTIAIGIAKAVLLKAGVPWTADGFWIHAPVLMAAGLMLPVLGKVIVLRRIPPLDRMTD